jgi:hypothetical protein
MTERQFLDQQSRRVRERLHRGSVGLHDEIERAVGPTVREHPCLSLVAGASAGFLLGRVLWTPSRSAVAGTGRGMLAGSFRFVKDTGIFFLRSLIVGSLLSSSTKGHAAPERSTAAST